MAERTTVARPYADAAFQIAREENALPRWSEMLEFAESVVGDAQMVDALSNPRLDGAARASLLVTVGGERFTPPMRNFVRVLAETGRLGLMPEVRQLFELARNEAEGVATARIETAQPLSEAQVKTLTEGLAKRFGKRIEATVSVNKDLIGGVRIAVGDAVIDGSVRGKLEHMKHDLLS